MINLRSCPKIKCETHPKAYLIEDYHAGDVICAECGLVVGDRTVDVGREWRMFLNEKNQSRVGEAFDSLSGTQNLATFIEKTPAGVFGNFTSRFSSETYAEKSKRKVTAEIKEMADRLSADQSIINSAQHLYSKLEKNKFNKGRLPKKAIVAACIFIACRQQASPRTFKEICAVCDNVSVKEIGRCYKLIRKRTDLIDDLVDSSLKDIFVERFCSKLNLPKRVFKLSEKILENISKISSLKTRSPNSLAAVCIYYASEVTGDKRSFEEIGVVCGASEVTIKQILKNIAPFKDQIIPEEFKKLDSD